MNDSQAVASGPIEALSIVIADYQDPQHRADLLALLQEYALDPCGGGEPLPEICQRELLDRLAAFPGAFSILAYRDGQALGLVNCFMGFSTFMCKPLVNIHDVTVSEAARGLGVCTLMFEKVVEVARERDCCKITLEVLEKNHPARAAYRKCGFKPYALDEEYGQAEFWQRYL
ncbi:GNAT family N-acetyltransferase [Microbulbifer sp. CAU 1566]|uniref:GNAT family N-acetyltransferase n=1 Tax=Microbulbifer sp. CAU 1566 TaxID=2933269 RepID=UPI002006A893|nr:GNAT family N-acetyltransferase [Microbulbifer sp. CAU 1566]MCK7598275.1 GNAT family N-acetyltransferase [Microbulbifer sp. CAU 1566]